MKLYYLSYTTVYHINTQMSSSCGVFLQKKRLKYKGNNAFGGRLMLYIIIAVSVALGSLRIGRIASEEIIRRRDYPIDSSKR